MERHVYSQLLHYFDVESHRLACGFAAAHINWTLDAGPVDCLGCRQFLDRRAVRRVQRAAAEPRVEQSIGTSTKR
jgi:hypothetical protein